MTVRDHPVNKQNYGIIRDFCPVFCFATSAPGLSKPGVIVFMSKKPVNKTKALTVSGLVIAMYVTIMYFTQGFAFGAYQIRVATGLYSLSYLFPFLILPLGLANSLGNFLGGLGSADIFGGFAAGIVTSGGVYLIRRFRLPMPLIIPVIILGPGLIVPIWLSYITEIPYPALALSLCLGQAPPAVSGYLLVKLLKNWSDKL